MIDELLPAAASTNQPASAASVFAGECALCIFSGSNPGRVAAGRGYPYNRSHVLA
jgi:hypothetical protein